MLQLGGGNLPPKCSCEKSVPQALLDASIRRGQFTPEMMRDAADVVRRLRRLQLGGGNLPPKCLTCKLRLGVDCSASIRRGQFTPEMLHSDVLNLVAYLAASIRRGQFTPEMTGPNDQASSGVSASIRRGQFTPEMD